MDGLTVQAITPLHNPALARSQCSQPALQLSTAFDIVAACRRRLILINEMFNQGAIIAVGNRRIQRTDVLADAEKLTNRARILADVASKFLKGRRRPT